MRTILKGYFDPDRFAEQEEAHKLLAVLSPGRLHREGRLSFGQAGLALVLIITIAALDQSVSGLNVFLLHVVPVSLIAWRGGFTHGLWAASCAAVAQLLDGAAWPSGLAAVVRAGNAALAFGLFAGAAWTVARLKARRRREQILQAHLEEGRPDRLTAATEIKRLHEQLHLYRDWTNHLKRVGGWVSLDDFLNRPKEAEPVACTVGPPPSTDSDRLPTELRLGL